MTELFVIEVVDPDLCQILGLEDEGPARPNNLHTNFVIGDEELLLFPYDFSSVIDRCNGKSLLVPLLLLIVVVEEMEWLW